MGFFNPSRMMGVKVMQGQLLFIMVFNTVRINAQELKSVNFSDSTLTLDWSDQAPDVAHLVDEGDCIYTGHLERDVAGVVLVTGCDEDSLSVQIQSSVVGDRLFSLVNGTVVYPSFSEEDFRHEEEYEDIENDYFDVVAEKNGRQKRAYEEEDEDDYDYEYDEEPEENPEFDKNYPNLDGYELEDYDTPEKLVFNINVYLDESWLIRFGEQAEAKKVARQVLKHARQLFLHQSLDTKMDLQFGDRIYISSAPELKPNKKGVEIMKEHPQAPFKMDGEYAVTHLQLTADTTRRTSSLGKATIASICSENPRVIVKYGLMFSVARLGMTVAHELGHTLGMRH